MQLRLVSSLSLSLTAFQKKKNLHNFELLGAKCEEIWRRRCKRHHRGCSCEGVSRCFFFFLATTYALGEEGENRYLAIDVCVAQGIPCTPSVYCSDYEARMGPGDSEPRTGSISGRADFQRSDGRMLPRIPVRANLGAVTLPSVEKNSSTGTPGGGFEADYHERAACCWPEGKALVVCTIRLLSSPCRIM